jgi:antitoxin (DNA-binding transcriptional repressor) of toxin-antitoxin stability system
MKQVSISQLKQLKTDEIKDGGCLEITSDGEVVATIIVGAESLMKDKIRVLASQIDAARGK